MKSACSHISRLGLPVFAAVLVAGSACGQPTRVEIAAHRGGYKLFPENTCVAFRACEDIADRIEFDVRTSADGELVVIHDETVNRTTTGFGAVTNVADLTLAQLKTLDAGSVFSPRFAGERIPTLAEALRSLPPGIPAMVHCKAASAKAIVDVLRAENALSNVCVACGGLDPLFAVHQIDPAIELAYEGTGPIGTNNVAVAQRMGVRTFLWYKENVTPALVDLVHSAGMRVAVSAPGSECRKFIDMGVDRILSDDPKTARKGVLHSPGSVPVAGPNAAGRDSGFSPPDWRPGALRPNGLAQAIRPLSPETDVAKDASRSELSYVSPVSLGQDLVAHWKLDDGLSDSAAVNAEDAAGHSRGRLVGFASNPGWVSGADTVAGGALRLDGRDDYVRLPPNEFLDIGANAVSLSLWVNLSVLPSRLSEDYSFIYGSDLASYSLYLDRNRGELQFRATDATRHFASPGIPEAALQTGVWHHVVGVYDGSATSGAGRVSIYLDGQLQDAHVGADDSPGLGLTQAVLPGQFAALGRRGDQDEFYFSGILDDVALWRRPLAPAEIVLIHASGSEHIPLDGIKDDR